MTTEELELALRVHTEKCLEAIYERAQGDGDVALRCIESALNGLRVQNNEEISQRLGLTGLV